MSACRLPPSLAGSSVRIAVFWLPIQSGLFELKLDPYRKDRSRYVHRICRKQGKPPTAVPARFLVACEGGHLDDFPWVEFVHRGKTDCHYELRLYELGASGEVADIEVQCVKCEKKRRMSDAFSEDGKAELSHCRGRWPHLRKFDEDPCTSQQKSILLGASNSWFPMMLSVLSIPSTPDKLGQLIEQNWAELEECESPRDVKMKRKLLRGMASYSEEQIWQAVENKKSGSDASEDEASDLRDPEWSVFSNPDPNLNSRDFKLRVVDPPQNYGHVLEKVVLGGASAGSAGAASVSPASSLRATTATWATFPKSNVYSLAERPLAGCRPRKCGAKACSCTSPRARSKIGWRRREALMPTSLRPIDDGGRREA